MKKLFIFILIITLSLTACGKVAKPLDDISANDIIIDELYNVVYFRIDDGFFVVEKSDKDSENMESTRAYMNLNGEILNNQFYNDCLPFNEGLSVVFINLKDKEQTSSLPTKVNILNKKGETVINQVNGKNIDFLESPFFMNGKLLVGFASEKSADFKLIDASGNIIKPETIKQEQIVAMPNLNTGKYISCNKEDYNNNEELRFYLENNIDERPPILPSNPNNEDEIIFVLDRLAATKDNEYLLVDGKGQILKNFSTEYGDVNFAKLNNLYKNEYLAINFTNKNSIIVDYDGNLVTETNYQNLGRVYNGYVDFEKDGKFGLLDIKGELVLAPEYDAVSNVYNKHVLLKKGNKTYIHQLFSE